MEDSSEDDIPIGARRSFKAATTVDLTEDSDGGSPLPDWISQHTPVTAARPSPDSSNSEDGVTLVSQSEPVDPSQPTGTAAPKQSQATGGVTMAVTKPRPAAAFKEAGKGGLPPAGNASVAALSTATALKAASGGEIPLVMPEKLAKGRWLVELEAVEDVKADLAGDAGVVGRFSLSEKHGAEKHMLLDLKGLTFRATVMPAATTLCIVNVQVEEAKVEGLMDSFVSLRQEAALGGAKAGPEDAKNYFLYADDAEDNYQINQEAEQPAKMGKKRKGGEEEDDAPRKKKAAAIRQGAGRTATVKKKRKTTGKKPAAKGSSKGQKRK